MMQSPLPEYPQVKGLSPEEKRAVLNAWAIQCVSIRLEQSKAAGIEWMEWLAAGDGRDCAHCCDANGKVVAIDDFDVRGHVERCTCELGCRCTGIASFDP